MNTNRSKNLKLGKSTLQGGLTSEEVVTQIYTFQLPDFQVANVPRTDGQTIGLTIFNSLHNFGEALTFTDDNGKEVVYAYDWGNSVSINQVLIDNFGVLKDSVESFGEYYSVDLTNAFIKIGEGDTAQIIDNRLGDFRMSFSLNLEQNAIGSRTLAFMGWIWEPELYTVNYFAPLFEQTFTPSVDGSRQFHLETQRFGFNLLGLRREAIAATNYQGDKNNLRMSIGFHLHQTSDRDLRVDNANLWLKKTNERIDPDRFRGLVS